MEKNRRDVEERAEQLKSLGNLAALVAGFAVVAFLEFGDDEGFKRNPALTLCFGITAALVVCIPTAALHSVHVHNFSCKIATTGTMPYAPAIYIVTCEWGQLHIHQD